MPYHCASQRVFLLSRLRNPQVRETLLLFHVKTVQIPPLGRALAPGVTGHWRGHGAGVARAYALFFGLGGAGVVRAWRGRGPVTPGARPRQPRWPAKNHRTQKSKKSDIACLAGSHPDLPNVATICSLARNQLPSVLRGVPLTGIVVVAIRRLKLIGDWKDWRASLAAPKMHITRRKVWKRQPVKIVSPGGRKMSPASVTDMCVMWYFKEIVLCCSPGEGAPPRHRRSPAGTTTGHVAEAIPPRRRRSSSETCPSSSCCPAPCHTPLPHPVDQLISSPARKRKCAFLAPLRAGTCGQGHAGRDMRAGTCMKRPWEWLLKNDPPGNDSPWGVPKVA
eukprot:gene3116-biopygen6647